MNKVLTIGFLILFALIVMAITTIDFETPIADRITTKCDQNLDCFAELDSTGGFSRYITLIDPETLEKKKWIMIEDYPVETIEVKR